MDRITSMTTFTTVVTSGSFAAAAQRLNMSPAMVTNHVRALEERLGARLLNRTTRKLSLTEAGEHYYEACARILSEIDEADARVASLSLAPRGTLRANAAAVFAPAVVPLFSAFAAAFPEITLDLDITDRMPDLVEDGLDVAVRFNPEPESNLIRRQLGSFRVIAVAAPSYLAERGTPREPADLVRHNCLAYRYRGFMDLAHEWRLRSPKGEVVPVQVSGNLRTNSINMLRTAALAGRGIALAPNWVQEDIRAGRLVRVLPEYDSGELPVVALYPHRQHLPAKVRGFIDFAAKHFAEVLEHARPPEATPAPVFAARQPAH